MKLFFFPVAPNPTKARLYLAEKRALGCPIELEEVFVNLIEGEQKSPEMLARNPFGVLPVLELDDGRHLIESLSIIDYLEDLHPEPSIWGPDPEARAMARQIERIADIGGLIPIARSIHATNSPLGYPANPPVAKHYHEIYAPKLAYLEGLLEDGRTYLTGETPSVADCTLAAAFQFGRFRNTDCTEGLPRLQSWQERYRSRDFITSIITG